MHVVFLDPITGAGIGRICKQLAQRIPAIVPQRDLYVRSCSGLLIHFAVQPLSAPRNGLFLHICIFDALCSFSCLHELHEMVFLHAR